MGVFSNVKKQDISGLKFADLWLSHPDVDPNTKEPRKSGKQAHPCSENYENQCAVRMSHALIEWGIDFSDYPEPTCPGKGDYQGNDYARGAESLMNYLYHKIKRYIPYQGGRTNKNLAKQAKKSLENRKGIVLFKDIGAFRGGIGDHIDIWNGKNTTSGEYFETSKKIYFIELLK